MTNYCLTNYGPANYFSTRLIITYTFPSKRIITVWPTQTPFNKTNYNLHTFPSELIVWPTQPPFNKTKYNLHTFPSKQVITV